MTSYADTGFLVSLYLPETTTVRAEKAIREAPLPVVITPLTLLELRNALNFASLRGQITAATRDRVWKVVEEQLADGFYQLLEVSQADLYIKARQLSDHYTPVIATRSLDLIHVAAALLSKASLFLTFDERQTKAAKGEGVKVKP